MNKKLLLGLTALSLITVTVLSGCTKKETSKTTQEQITIATNANSKPNTYMQDKKLTGYDI